MRPRRALRSIGLLVALTIGISTVTAQAANNSPNPYVQSVPVSTITVSAAASLTDVFPIIATAFNKRYPQITVTFNFAGSNALVQQLRAGAPADVIATADEKTMQKAVASSLAQRPMVFARNSMAIATPAGNPADVRALKDLQSQAITTAICAPTVPCGRLATELFTKNKVNVTPVTKEVDVRAVVGKVVADAVDAGIVYSTDAKAAGDAVTTIEIPDSQNLFTSYPIATVTESKNARAAKTFVDYVRYSSTAQHILRAWGFSKP